MLMHMCPICSQFPDDQGYHSTYLGHPIEYGEVKGKKHYHSNYWAAGSLAEIKAVIRNFEN